MTLLPSPPSCGHCDDEYEPHDHPDYQGFCSLSCWEADTECHVPSTSVDQRPHQH